jgi:hypothetical protein
VILAKQDPYLKRVDLESEGCHPMLLPDGIELQRSFVSTKTMTKPLTFGVSDVLHMN